MYSQIRLTRLSSTGCFLSSRSPVTSSLQSLYNMKHILAYTSSFVKSRLHIDQPQILHRSFFNDSSCKSINIRFAFPTSPASVCQMSNSGKPGIPIGTSSLRNSILLSVTFCPTYEKRRHACIVCQADYFRTYPGSCKNLNLPGSFPHKFFLKVPCHSMRCLSARS